MSSKPEPRRSPFVGCLVAFGAVFVAGLACGVGADRYWLAPGSPTKSEPASLRKQLIGSWLAENGTKTEFKTDGTFDETFRETVPDIKLGEVVDDPSKLKMIEREVRITGQYEWVEDNKIQVRMPDKPSRRLKLVVEGDALTILEVDGKVARLKRQK